MIAQNIPFGQRQSPSLESNSSTDLANNLFSRVLLNSQTVNSYREDIDSSTTELVNIQLLSDQVSSIFINAKEEIFEDGMESNFSLDLSRFITSFGHSAMEVIIPIILSEYTNTEVASEAFRILGRINNKITYRDRLWLLERGLYNISARVRDGAILGLAFLNDPLAIAPLKAAIERENNADLRKDMEQILAQLEGFKDGVPTKKDTKK